MFVEMSRNKPQTKILDFLADHPDYDYSVSDLAKNTGVSRPTVYKIIKTLEDSKLVIKTRKLGKSNMYKLNLKNKLVRTILKFDFEIAKIIADIEEKNRTKHYKPVPSSSKSKIGIKQ